MLFSKINISKLVMIVSLFSFLQTLVGCGCSDGSLFFNYGYNISKGHVYYKQSFPKPILVLDYADASTFKIIRREADSMYADNGYFGTDKQSVYYQGYKITGSDGPSFELLSVYYSKDKAQCYYKGAVIQGADPATFSIKDNDYSVDKGHVFRREIPIDNDTSVFETFDSSSIYHTAHTVCINDAVVQIPTGVTFKHLGRNFFALGSKMFYRDEPMADGDIKNFAALGDYFAKTNKSVYYGSKIITNANPASFRPLAAPYSIDDKHVFFFEKTIDGADPKTFEVLNPNYQCARDKHAVYSEGKKIIGFTKADLVNKNYCNSCTENSINFSDSSVTK